MCNDAYIMIIDDDFDNFLILSELFKDIGYGSSFLFIENETKVIPYLDKIEMKYLPELIVLDLWMPLISGIDILVYLKQSVKLKDIPVVMYTSIDDSEQREKCLNLGAEDYLVKPYSMREGKAVVEKFLSYLPQLTK
jgi:CheY-like chemotaxis protein